MSQRLFRIHPSIGVARVGNSPESFYLGAERPNEPPNFDSAQKKFRPFRDNQGLLKRQAARFRLFEYAMQGSKRVPVREVVVDGKDIIRITWKVHLANRKAAFFIFNGQDGADGRWKGKLTKDGTGKTIGSLKLRNQKVADRNSLVIDPGPKAISGPNQRGVAFANPNRNIPIQTLGELRTDERGNLLVLGGRGEANPTNPVGHDIVHYTNNEEWFDDMSDGPVTAEVVIRVNGVDQTVRVEGRDAAWVLVGPPDFAPAVGNIITLYDTMWDVAVREAVPLPEDEGLYDQGHLARLKAQKKDWNAQTNTFRTYKPSFLHEIYPLLVRALNQRHVFNPVSSKGYHVSFLGLEADLGSVASSRGKRMRKSIFGYMRNPSNNNATQPLLMPKGFGDKYTDFPDEKSDNMYMSLTRVQYALLQRWAEGQFLEDWNPTQFQAVPPNITADGLDRAALENAVGGPFFPGIDCSWLVRRPELYALPFRMSQTGRAFPNVPIEPGLDPKILDVRAGFFSQQMALPWQADFFECKKQANRPNGGEAMYHMWWSSHRPDDVYAKKGDPDMVSWTRVLEQNAAANAGRFAQVAANLAPKTPEEAKLFFEVEPEHVAMFDQMTKNWHTLGFVINEGEHYFETQEKDGAPTATGGPAPGWRGY